MGRKLVAIMALDVVGYSRLMSDDETGTLDRVNRLFSTLVGPAISAHQGRVVKTMGDGLLAEFASAVEAVTAGARIQQSLRASGETAVSALTLRIGINLGDVLVQDDDLYGQGVNVAARLESLARPGEILVSSGIREQVAHKLPLDFDDLGEHALKNIPYPVRVYRVRGTLHLAEQAGPATVAAAGIRWRRAVLLAALAIPVLLAGGWLARHADEATPPPDSTPASVAAPPTVLVLPFDDLSEHRDQEYFVDGITEDIITDLAHYSGLRVLARNTSFLFKGKTVDPVGVGRDLAATHLLEGSVRRAGEQLRVTAQLIDTATGTHLWAQRYDRRQAEVFSVQDEVREQIVAALALQLTDRERHAWVSAPASVEAYDLALQGRAAMNLQTRDSNLRAQALFRSALELDPDYGRAHALLAIALDQSANRGWGEDHDRLLDEALAHAKRGVALSGSEPQTHWAMGYVQMHRGNFDMAIQAVQEAVEVAPSYADGYSLLALLHTILGEGQEALAIIGKAMALNPHYSWDYLLTLGRARYITGDYAGAVEPLRQSLERNVNARNPRVFLAASYAALGRIDDAEWEVSQLTMLYDNVTLGEIDQTNPIVKPELAKRLQEHLRLAGVPE